MVFETGDRVAWKWGNGTAEGTISKIYTEKVTRQIKGAEVTRVASQQEPAFEITQDDGDLVLKSCTEVRRAT